MKSLRARAVLVAATLVASLVVLALLVANRADAALKDLERARFEAQARQLADVVSYPVLARSSALLEEPLSAFRENPDLVVVDVRDDTHTSLLRRSGPASAGPGDVDVMAVVRTRARPPGDDDPFAAELGPATPRDVGSVVAVFSSRSLESVQQRTRRAILASVFGVGAVGLGAVLLLVTSAVRRLRALQHAAARVRQGDLTVRVDDNGQDELSLLAADFNRMTASLKRQGQELAERESLAALGRATAVIAHELKNPLGIVLGAAEVAASDARPEGMRREAAGIIVDETRRLAATLEELLAYARPQPARREAVDVVALSTRVAQRMALPGGPAVGCQVDVVAAGAAVASADPAQLERAVWNLIQNAAQARATRVEIRIAVRDDAITMVVSDDGDGVPTALHDQLFVPFSTDKQRGTGLGLAGARRTLRDVDGDLCWTGAGLSSRGATFVITLRTAERAS
jgi:signal transduction histidine kinase